jgi:hypothetical protein
MESKLSEENMKTVKKLGAEDPTAKKIYDLIDTVMESRGYTYILRQDAADPTIISVDGATGYWPLIDWLQEKLGHTVANERKQPNNTLPITAILDRSKIDELDEKAMEALRKDWEAAKSPAEQAPGGWVNRSSKINTFSGSLPEEKILCVTYKKGGVPVHYLVSTNESALNGIRSMNDVAALIFKSRTPNYSGIEPYFAGLDGLYSVHLNEKLLTQNPSNLSKAIEILQNRGYDIQQYDLTAENFKSRQDPSLARHIKGHLSTSTKFMVR